MPVFTTVNVDVEVDLTDIATEDLIEELKERNQTSTVLDKLNDLPPYLTVLIVAWQNGWITLPDEIQLERFVGDLRLEVTP